MRTFGYQPEADFPIDYRTEDIHHVFKKLPSDWFPDILIVWSPVYYPLPPKIEECPVPTAAIVGDWHNAFGSMADNLARFDLILTDKKGCEVFERCGLEKVEYYPMYSFDPAVHQKIFECEKVYDVVFAGYHEGYLPGRRMDFLRRLIRMEEKYRIKILSGIHGEPYARLLNQAKIGFNHSIRGEMNMRAYEAPACGTLLMMEEDNLEVRDFLAEGKECVLYNEENFEELIETYVNQDELREEIADAGHQRIQGETHDKHFADLLDKLSDRLKNLDPATPRSFQNRSPADQSYLTARYYAFHSACNESVGIRQLGEALQVSESARVCEAMALFHVRTSQRLNDAAKRTAILEKAEEFFKRAEDPLMKACHGEFNLELAKQAAQKGTQEESLRRARAAHSLLTEAISGVSDEGIEIDSSREVYPPPTDPFRIELESVLAEGGEAKKIFLGRLWLLRGIAERLIPEKTVEEAAQSIRKAIELWPNSLQCHLELVDLLISRQEWQDAATMLECTIRLAPLRVDLLDSLADIYAGLDDDAKSEEVRQLRRLVQGRVESAQ